MKKIILYLFIFIGSQSFSQTEVPLLDQVISMGGSSSESSSSIAIDNSGNTYTTGTFMGTADFDPSASTLNLVSNGDRDVFIQKTDALGNLVWAKSIGGNLFDTGNSIKVDVSGNIYVVGNFKSTVDFDPSAAIFNLTSTGEYDTFILKLNSNGDFIWVKSIGGPFDDIANSIELDNSGNVYCTGYFYGTVDFDPNAGTLNLNSNGSYDAYIQKLDLNGNLVWAKSFGGSSVDASKDLTIDLNGDILLTGHFRNTVDFDMGVNVFNLSSNGNYDIFVLKLNLNGDFIWATSTGGSLADKGQSIATDNSGNVICTGFFYGTVDFNTGVGIENIISNGNADVFVQKLDISGNYLWTKTFGGTGDDKGNSITADSDGDIYTTGLFKNTIDLNPGADNNSFTSNGVDDIFIQKLSVAGNYIWAASFGGSTYDNGLSLLVDNNDNVICAGSYGTTVDFDPSPMVLNMTSAGVYDAFILKITQCQTTNTTDVHTACNSFVWVDGITYTTSNNSATYTYTNQDGCDSTLTLDLTINSVDITVTNNSPTLIANSNSGTYQWVDCNDNNSAIIGEANQTFTASTNGSYAVEVSQNGCTLLSNCETISNVGLEYYSTKQIVAYPNPTTNNIIVELGDFKQNIHVIVYDVMGNQINTLFFSSTNQLNIIIDGESGIYFIEIYSTLKRIARLKVLKE